MKVPAKSTAVLLIIALMPLTQLYAAPPDGYQWQMIWQDEFEGETIDATKWEIMGDWQRRVGWWLKDDAYLDGNGNLVLRTRRVPNKPNSKQPQHWGTDGYSSGAVRTRGRFEHAYGYYEARMDITRQTGHWPAFWLFNQSVNHVGNEGRDGTEIDIMESFDCIYHTLHWDGYGEAHQSEGKKVLCDRMDEMGQGFHTFGLLWTPQEYVFYVDGHETHRSKAGGVCQVPLYIKLTDEIDLFMGDVSTATLPSHHLVDYVRVYEQVTPGPYPLSTLSSGPGTVTASPQQNEYDAESVVQLTAVPENGHQFMGWSGDTTSSDNPLTITMQRGWHFIARFVKPGEMLISGGFDEGITGWKTWINEQSTAQATQKVVDGVWTIDITQLGSNDWDVHMNNTGLQLKQGEQYTISFDAWADGQRPLTVATNLSVAPYQPCFSRTVDLTETPQGFSFWFKMDQEPHAEPYRIEFNSGAALGKVYIDNVSFVHKQQSTSTAQALPQMRNAAAGINNTVRHYDPAGRQLHVPQRASQRHSPGLYLRFESRGKATLQLGLGHPMTVDR